MNVFKGLLAGATIGADLGFLSRLARNPLHRRRKLWFWHLFRWCSGSLLSPMAQSGPKMIPKILPNGSIDPKMAPKWPPNEPKMVLKWHPKAIIGSKSHKSHSLYPKKHQKVLKNELKVFQKHTKVLLVVCCLLFMVCCLLFVVCWGLRFGFEV